MTKKAGELAREVEELKRVVKSKDLMIMQLEEEAEEKVKEMRDGFADARRKLVQEIEERLNRELQEKGEF